jgi:hypothetical protein
MPNQSPIWNSTLTFDIGNGEHLIDRNIEVNLWDLVPQNESIFLGECLISLQVRKKYLIRNFLKYFIYLECFNRGPRSLVSRGGPAWSSGTDSFEMSSFNYFAKKFHSNEQRCIEIYKKRLRRSTISFRSLRLRLIWRKFSSSRSRVDGIFS